MHCGSLKLMSVEALVRWGMRIRSLEWELMLTRSVPSSPCASVALLWSTVAAADWGVKTLFLLPHHHLPMGQDCTRRDLTNVCFLLSSPEPKQGSCSVFPRACPSHLVLLLCWANPTVCGSIGLKSQLHLRRAFQLLSAVDTCPILKADLGLINMTTLTLKLPPPPYFCIVLAVWHGYFFFGFSCC